jgi:hypothetical protein
MPHDPTATPDPRPERRADAAGAEPPEPLETAEALWDALRRRLDPYVPDGTLGAALRRISREARSRGLGASDVLAELRRILGELPAVRRAATPEERERALARLIALCLEEYYGGE